MVGSCTTAPPGGGVFTPQLKTNFMVKFIQNKRATPPVIGQFLFAMSKERMGFQRLELSANMF